MHRLAVAGGVIVVVFYVVAIFAEFIAPYDLAYTIKFRCKALGQDFVVAPPEGLWWAENMDAFSLERKDEWLWTLMIAMPEWVTHEMVEESRQEVAQKKDLLALPQLRFETYHEGLSVQIMYLGAYADEGPTLMRWMPRALGRASKIRKRTSHLTVILEER